MLDILEDLINDSLSIKRGIIGHLLAFELIPPQIVVLKEQCMSLHNSNTFREDVLWVQVLRHLNFSIYHPPKTECCIQN